MCLNTTFGSVFDNPSSGWLCCCWFCVVTLLNVKKSTNYFYESSLVLALGVIRKKNSSCSFGAVLVEKTLHQDHLISSSLKRHTVTHWVVSQVPSSHTPLTCASDLPNFTFPYHQKFYKTATTSFNLIVCHSNNIEIYYFSRLFERTRFPIRLRLGFLLKF